MTSSQSKIIRWKRRYISKQNPVLDRRLTQAGYQKVFDVYLIREDIYEYLTKKHLDKILILIEQFVVYFAHSVPEDSIRQELRHYSQLPNNKIRLQLYQYTIDFILGYNGFSLAIIDFESPIYKV